MSDNMKGKSLCHAAIQLANLTLIPAYFTVHNQ